MAERPNPLARMMQQAAALKEQAVPRPAHPSRVRRSATRPAEAERPSSGVRRRSGRPLYEERFRRATFFLAPEQLDEIAEAADRLGLGKSEFVRLAVSEALDRHSP